MSIHDAEFLPKAGCHQTLNSFKLLFSDSETELEYEPQIDVERFKKLLALAEIEKAKSEQQRLTNKGAGNRMASRREEPGTAVSSESSVSSQGCTSLTLKVLVTTVDALEHF